MDFEKDLREQIIEELNNNQIVYNKKTTTYHLLVSYLNVLNRMINPKPRKVYISDNIKNIMKNNIIDEKIIDSSYIDSLKELKYDFIKGIDITTYLSKNIYSSYLFVDKQYYVENKKHIKILKSKSRDDLLAEWGIHHIHLIKDGSTKKDKIYLLFVKVNDDTVYFIDIKEHETKNFSKIEIVETMNRNWPYLTKNYLIHNIKLSNKKVSTDEVKERRGKNQFTLDEINGKTFMPLGGGVMSDGTPRIIIEMADGIFEDIKFFKDNWKKIDESLKLKLRWVGNGFIITNLVNSKSLYYHIERENLTVTLIK